MSMTLEKGVRLHVMATEKYKTVRVLVRFATPLTAATISKRTLLSSLLETNSQKYPTQTKLSEKLADLYGASFGITINKKGDSHYVSVILNVVNDKFLPNDASVLPEAIDFLKEIMFKPNIQNQQFEATTFEREKTNLQEYIGSVYDDKQSHAALALQELYFSDNPNQRIPSFGTIEALEGETAASLATYYQKMLAEDQVDIMVIGDVEADEMVRLFKELPFSPRSSLAEQEYYYQDLVPEIKLKTEKQSVIQSKLNLAFQTGIYYQEDGYFPLQVFNGLFGGFPHSKLFMNVREKESMAYYASSSIDTFRGMMTVQTGIDGRNKERVLMLVDEQLASLVKGDISAEELAQTKEMLKNQYILSLDNSQAVVEKTYLAAHFDGQQLTDEDWLAAVDQVTIADVQAVAQGVKLQATYFMEGEQTS